MLLDILCESDGRLISIEHPRLDWDASKAHGSGCRLAAAIAAILAQNKAPDGLADAVRQAVGICSQS